MKKFYLEEPTIKRREEAIEYINEFYQYKSSINGTGGLQRYLDNYEDWLLKLKEDYTNENNPGRVPALTYFLIRTSDDKIIGMINIRLKLNDELRKKGGNIGYCIRPTEREKGYNKINLYLGLKVCDNYGIKKVMLDALKDNVASWKTMEALSGEKIEESFNQEENGWMVKYEIDVKRSLENNSSYYEALIDE